MSIAATSTTRPEAEATAAPLPIMTLSLPRVHATVSQSIYLQGTINGDAEVTINGLAVPTEDFGNGVSFSQELTVTQPITDVAVEAVVDDGVLGETVTVLYDPDFSEQLAYVEEVDPGVMTITADYVEILSGEEALAAAREDGLIPPDGELGGDFYIRNQNPELVTLAISPILEPTLQACYEFGPCVVQRPVDLAAWAGLTTTERSPIRYEGWIWYGNGQLPYTLTFDGDDLVGISEFYLP
ncbi:hypothetical protein BH18ACT6_BH18ACT6_09070 [soil metagenome]